MRCFEYLEMHLSTRRALHTMTLEVLISDILANQQLWLAWPAYDRQLNLWLSWLEQRYEFTVRFTWLDLVSDSRLHMKEEHRIIYWNYV